MVPDIIAPQSRDLTKKTVTTGGGQYHNQEVHDHGSKSLAILALIFGVGGVFMALALAILLYGLWSRHDLLRIYYNDIRTELIRQGGNPHPHMPSESP